MELLTLVAIGAGFLLISVVFGVVGGYIWNQGVLGVVRRTEMRTSALETEIADLQTRVVKLSKQRAADASVEARQSRKSLEEEAQERLNLESSPARATARPSVINFGGK